MNLQTLLANRHTTFSAGGYAAVKVLSRIAVTWWPSHKEQIETTADALEGFAVLYLGAAAGDAMQQAKQVQEAKAEVADAINSGDTSHLSKSTTPPPNPS